MEINGEDVFILLPVPKMKQLFIQQKNFWKL